MKKESGVKIVCQFNPGHTILEKNGKQTKFCLDCAAKTGWEQPPPPEQTGLGKKIGNCTSCLQAVYEDKQHPGHTSCGCPCCDRYSEGRI